MSRKLGLSVLYLTFLMLAVVPVGAAKKQSSAARPAIDPRAQQILRQMSDYLASLNQFKVHANTTIDFLTTSNMVLNADKELDVWVERPNRIRVNSFVPDHDRQVVYNGQTITIYSPKQNYYTVVPALSSIDQTVDGLRAKGVELPLADFVFSNPYSALMGRARHGYYIGQSLVNGVLCNQLAFRGKDMDWQIWVEDGQTPLPRRVVIVDRLVTGRPKYTATFTDWDVSPTFAADLFTFTPPEGAKKVQFVSPGLAGMRGMRR